MSENRVSPTRIHHHDAVTDPCLEELSSATEHMDLTGAVPVEVVSCSSEDPPHTGKRLSSQYGVAVLRALLGCSGSGINDDSVGWHAEKFCEYPQEIVFRVCDPDAAPSVRSLIVVSHATLIAHRIEIFLSSSIVRDWRKARFDRLGFITLQSPQVTHCAAQELKTVPLSPRANEKITFLRLLIHTCHVHTLNIFNQVGLACFVVLAENSSHQADGESLVTAVKKRIKEERSSVPTMEASPEIRPWPTTVSRTRAMPSQQIPSASQEVWIAERKEYVTPVELLTRIQLARERHAVILQNAVAEYQRDQQQWAADEFECVQWIDKLSQLSGWEVAMNNGPPAKRYLGNRMTVPSWTRPSKSLWLGSRMAMPKCLSQSPRCWPV
jgi:hypothetical protein